jgi:hypothetical protein
MSWDSRIVSVKCLCGNGTIDQEISDDDWGRSREGFPIINCNECKKKYKIIEIRHHSYKPMRGDYVAYYAVPLSFNETIPFITTYKEPELDALIANFPLMLVVKEPLGFLKELSEELKNVTNVSSLKDLRTRDLINWRKRYLHSCKTADLKTDVEDAIVRYNSFGVNFELLQFQKDENQSIQKEYESKVAKQGILLDL